VLYEQKHKEQKKLYYGGAEAHKLKAIEICVKKLSTKLNIAIHIVNATSKKINKLRDEELWFQTHELIRGYVELLNYSLSQLNNRFISVCNCSCAPLH
jgi:hypothetical protein